MLGNQPPHPPTFGKDIPKKTDFFYTFPNIDAMPDSSHFMYMMKFTGCELLNLVNVLGQMYFMDRWVVNNFFMYIGIFNSISINIFVDRKKNRKTFVFRFLGGEFSTYGLKVSRPMLSGNSRLVGLCNVTLLSKLIKVLIYWTKLNLF